MDMDHNALDQIALTLTRHFDSLYYVDIETGNYSEYTSGQMLRLAGIPQSGSDFFTDAQQNASKCVHPDDLALVIGLHDKAVMLEHLSQNHFFFGRIQAADQWRDHSCSPF